MFTKLAWLSTKKIMHIYSLLRVSLFISHITDCCHYNMTFQLFLITCVCVHWCTVNWVKTTGRKSCLFHPHRSNQISQEEGGVSVPHISLSVCVSVAQMSLCALVSVFPEALSLSQDTIACSALTSWKDQGMCAAHISYMYCNTYLQ